MAKIKYVQPMRRVVTRSSSRSLQMQTESESPSKVINEKSSSGRGRGRGSTDSMMAFMTKNKGEHFDHNATTPDIDNHSPDNGNLNDSSNLNRINTEVPDPSVHQAQTSSSNSSSNDPVSLRMANGTASPIVVPMFNTNRLDQSSCSRPASRCSQNSATSATSGNRRAFTSRRGGRGGRSRSPTVPFTSRPNAGQSNAGQGQSSTLSSVERSSPQHDEDEDTNPHLLSRDQLHFTAAHENNLCAVTPKSPDSPSSAAATAAATAKLFCDPSNNPKANWFNENNEHIGQPFGMLRGSDEYHNQHSTGGGSSRDQWKNNGHPEGSTDYETGGKPTHTYEDNFHQDQRSLEQNYEHRNNSGKQSMSNFSNGRPAYKERSPRTGGLIIKQSDQSNSIRRPLSGDYRGTSRMMGSPTPIHTHASSKEDVEAYRDVRRQEDSGIDSKETSSIFRNTPGRKKSNAQEENSAQILLSLRTPTKSFDVDDKVDLDHTKETNKHGQTPLSPQEPPRIHHSHHQRSNPLHFFEPQRSPRTPRTPNNTKNATNGQAVEKSPSFNLFNQSFDSFGDAYIQPNNSVLKSPFPQSFSLAQSVDENSPSKTSIPFSPSPYSLTLSPQLKMKKPLPPLDKETFQSPGGISLGSVHSNPSFDAPKIPLDRELGKYEPKQDRRTIVLGPSDSLNGRVPMMKPKLSKTNRQKEEAHVSLQTKTAPHVPQHQNEPKTDPLEPNAKETTLPRNNQKNEKKNDASSTPNKRVATKNSESVGTEVQKSPTLKVRPHFYQRLLAHSDAFQQYKFLLPALAAAVADLPSSETTQTVNENNTAPTQRIKIEGDTALDTSRTPIHRVVPRPQVSYSPETKLRPPPMKEFKAPDKVIARRRVTSAVCAFGGNGNSPVSKQQQSTKKSTTTTITTTSTTTTTSSIFRVKRDRDQSSSPSRDNANKRVKYEEALSKRYFENDNRISWEFEENSPVEISQNITSSRRKDQVMRESIKAPKHANQDKIFDSEKSSDQGTPSNMDNTPIKKSSKNSNRIGASDFSSNATDDTKSVSSEMSSKGTSGNSDQPKMRYRCKLCGQPKQNHTCPYQQSLQRSIGVTIHPAVNAFTSSEPGFLAPALKDMNNFVPENFLSENTPSRPAMGQHMTGQGMMILSGPPHSVTPVTSKGAGSHHNSSPVSTLSSVSRTPRRTPFRVGSYGQYNVRSKLNGSQSEPRSIGRKRAVTPESANGSNRTSDLLFVDAAELRPEQYRIISSTIMLDSYQYPALPLPYAQRKSISDNLFSLSKEVPQLTDECAAVLRQARESDMWDIAVAELMTQVIVIVHCPENDKRLNGLSRYLLSLGFAC